MIIWSGFGFLIAVIVFGFALLCNVGFDAIYGPGYYEAHKWTIAVAMFLSAIICWLLGSFFRKRNSQTLIDPATGEEVILDRSSHRLFFIPMHTWGPILAIVGVVLLVMEFIQ